ncbi:MAG: 5-(carboxyamino)imidazole ribonucleotide synthase [Acidobacteria bacterium]|nr:5-(carboxyamino)imidazole ribonucleotide synthase [Acidobacteriota bacterium]
MSAHPPVIPPARIGIIGGGQLGRMMTQKAKRLGFRVIVLDPYPGAPAGQLADSQIVGDYHDGARLREIVERCDLTTYDLEGIDAHTLGILEKEGHLIRPGAALLALIQDKYAQRNHLARHGIPQPEFRAIEGEASAEAFHDFGYPLVQKLRKGGYDGRGVAVLRGPEDLTKRLPGECYVERCVDIDKELAVIVARSVTGDMKCYALVEMVFDPRANLLEMLLAPARVDPATAQRAEEISMATVESLGGVGVFGVELFLSTNGEILVNEVAPRPHNSGHYTYEACVTSQFEQHIRAVAGLPLGSVEQMRPAAMINLLGHDEGGAGPPKIDGFAEALAIPGVIIHVYGKAETRPFRKMGHVTVLGEDLDEARAKALAVKDKLRIHAGGLR